MAAVCILGNTESIDHIRKHKRQYANLWCRIENRKRMAITWLERPFWHLK